MKPSGLSRSVIAVEKGNTERCCFGLFRQRHLWLPTWRGWLLLFSLLALLLFVFVKTAHPFLAVSNGQPGGIIVLEGWSSDPAVEATAAEFKRGPYQLLLVTGGPIEAGAALALRPSYAELGETRLLMHGLTTNQVKAVPAPLAQKDRTYLAAATLKRWLDKNRVSPHPIHLISEGTHARRSRLLYQKALGKQWLVTVTAMPPMGYEPNRWWASSSGVKVVITELISYVYTIIFFNP